MDPVLTRFHAALVRSIQAARPDGVARPVTVAEIYQSLVPYRSAREALGVELNADYEHALLRLLAGEDELVRLEPPSARDELARELESVDPNVGLYRKFAACDVIVSPLPKSASEAAPEPEPEPAQRGRSAAPAGAGQGQAAAPQAEAADRPAGPEDGDAPSGAARTGGGAAAAPAAGVCPFCRKELPSARPARFCPFCGQDQSRRPCARCGDGMDPEWRFCISCGSRSDPA